MALKSKPELLERFKEMLLQGGRLSRELLEERVEGTLGVSVGVTNVEIGRLNEFFEARGHDGFEEGLFGGEVAIERANANARAFGHESIGTATPSRANTSSAASRILS